MASAGAQIGTPSASKVESRGSAQDAIRGFLGASRGGASRTVEGAPARSRSVSTWELIGGN